MFFCQPISFWSSLFSMANDLFSGSGIDQLLWPLRFFLSIKRSWYRSLAINKSFNERAAKFWELSKMGSIILDLVVIRLQRGRKRGV